jgi:hypothetical protein
LDKKKRANWTHFGVNFALFLAGARKFDLWEMAKSLGSARFICQELKIDAAKKVWAVL